MLAEQRHQQHQLRLQFHICSSTQTWKEVQQQLEEVRRDPPALHDVGGEANQSWNPTQVAVLKAGCLMSP